MAKIKGISPSKMSGSVGDFTYRQTQDGTIVSEKVQKGRKLPTLTQCRSRYQMINLANLATALLPAIRNGFKNAVNREIPAFVRANYNMQPVFIPKYLAESNACIVVPCQLTSGSLPPVNNTLGASDKVVSDIAVGNLAITANTTIAELSNAIISNNPDWRDGDQLSLIVATQHIVQVNQRTIPVASVSKYEVVLSSSSEKLSTMVPADLFSTSDGFLCMNKALVNQGAGFVHSRTVEGEVRVSTAFMVAKNEETISAYNTIEALATTAKSYGGYRDDAFLSSNGADPNTQEPEDGTADPSNPGGQGGGTETTYVLEFSALQNGTVTATRVDNGATLTSPATLAEDTQVRLQANPSSGYVFSKWSDDNTENPRIVIMSTEHKLEASFIENQGGGGDNPGGGMF